MCIICKCNGVNPNDPEPGSDFLSAFYDVQRAIETAKAAMHRCAKVDRSYDASHKAIVRMQRDWNRLEHYREAAASPHQTGAEHG
ncbi:MAG: hypothetical protein KGL39_38655 [Patescibacteria group bacterium]|nr:hypothetical protein [Patescibacteria group bacterium]